MQYPDLPPRHILNDRDRQQDLINYANYLRFKKALDQIVQVLGPDTLAEGCPDCKDACPGLVVEADEALRIAREALLGMHELPPEDS